MEIIETNSPREDAGKALGALLEENKDKPILLMLSGGSAFTILDFVPTAVLGSHITVTVLDERHSTDPQVNNFAQLEQTNFYKICLEQGAGHISTKVLLNESVEELRDRFDRTLHMWKEQHRNGVVIATMGIGADGHTAGIFPGKYGVDFNDDVWVVGYSVPKEVNAYTDRVTVTNTFLREEVLATVVFIEGAEKKQYVHKLLDESCDIGSLPSCIMREMASVVLITDAPESK